MCCLLTQHIVACCKQALTEEQHSPDVGSSRRMTEGLISSSCPTDTRLRSPPEIPLWKKPPAGSAMILIKTSTQQAAVNLADTCLPDARVLCFVHNKDDRPIMS